MIDTPAALAEFVERLRASPWVAMDTEADSLHAYPEKLCLVQISLPGVDALLDPLAGVDLQPLWRSLAGRSIVMHGADYDLRLLHRGQRFVPAEVFDTMLAARLLGLTEFGLTSLVDRFLGVKLEKGPQRADWSRRPLTDRMVAYACNDAHHLQPLAEVLGRQLDERGRRDWHAQMCRRLIEDATRPDTNGNGDSWRIRNSDSLGPHAQAVLRELWRWREHEALAANRPPFFILSHDALFALAVALTNGGSVDAVIPKRYSPRRRASLQSAMEKAVKVPQSEWPEPRRHNGRRLTAAQKHHLENLRRRRDRNATRLQIDPTLIASRATLAALASNWARESESLLPWQRELLAG